MTYEMNYDKAALSPCIEWTGARYKNKYGQMRIKGKTRYVHRVEWEKVHGPIPEGLFVCHKCDNPPCYRIEHLFLGTPADNVADAKSKGRLYGMKPKQRKEIFRRIKAGETYVSIAPDFGVTDDAIGKLARRAGIHRQRPKQSTCRRLHALMNISHLRGDEQPELVEMLCIWKWPRPRQQPQAKAGKPARAKPVGTNLAGNETEIPRQSAWDW